MKIKAFQITTVMLGILVGPAHANINTVSSILNLSSITGGTVSTAGTWIAFGPASPAQNFTIGGGNTGIFSSLTGTGSIMSIQNQTGFALNNFVTLANDPTFSLALTGLNAASGPALGQTISLFQLSPHFTLAAINVYGTGTLNSQPFTYTGSLTTQEVETIASIQSHGLRPSTWSLTLDAETVVTPEPGLLAVLGIGISACVLVQRRRRRI